MAEDENKKDSNQIKEDKNNSFRDLFTFKYSVSSKGEANKGDDQTNGSVNPPRNHSSWTGQEIIKTISDFFLVILTGLLAYYTYSLVHDSMEQTKSFQRQDSIANEALLRASIRDSITNIATQKALALSQQNIEWAEMTFQINKSSSIFNEQKMKIENMANVSFDSLNTPAVEVGKYLYVLGSYTNQGKTNAYHCRDYIGCKIGLGISASDFDTTKDFVGWNANLVLQPKQQVQTFTNFYFTYNDSLRIYKGKEKIFMYAKVWYEDRFGGYHYSTICNCYNITSKEWDMCEFNNDSD